MGACTKSSILFTLHKEVDVQKVLVLKEGRVGPNIGPRLPIYTKICPIEGCKNPK